MNVAFLDLKAVNARFEPQLSQAAQEVIASGWYINGRHCQEFEQAFARFIGTRHCVGTGNGLDALTLILTAMKQLEGWNNQTEVIVPAMTFIASAEAVNRAGLTPVLCDIDEDFVIAPDKIEPLIGPHTRALLPVHLYGHMADMTKLSEIASRYQLKSLRTPHRHTAPRRPERGPGTGATRLPSVSTPERIWELWATAEP